jgi:hypothetical protein
MNTPENPLEQLTQQYGQGVQQFVERVETDESFRKEVRAHPIEALTAAGLPEDLASATVLRACDDTTCFSSECPDSCYVSTGITVFCPR